MTNGKQGGARAAAAALRTALLVSTILGAAVPVLAQEATGTVAGQGGGSERVVVTARRREEDLQDVPISVSVVTADDLIEQGLTGTTDLSEIVPNLQFKTYGTLTGNNSAAQVFIRGIGQTDATPAVDPGVGVYIDEVYMGRSVGGAMDFRDIANVQVLRGPQGTLFGRNTIGGAVLMSTNRPGAGNRVRVGAGSDGLIEAFGAMDVPMTDTLAGRVSLGLRQRDGYVTRSFDGKDLGDDNTLTGQGVLEWDVTPNASVTFRADYTKEDENGSPFVFKEINETQLFPIIGSLIAGCPGVSFPPPTPVPATADPRCANDAQAMGDFVNGGTFPTVSDLENIGGSIVAEWQVNDVLTLKSISSVRGLEWNGSRDADNTPILVLHTQYGSRSDQISQEFQAQFDFDRLDGVFGLYYFDERSKDRLIVQLGTPGTSYDTQRVRMGTEAVAAFTEWTYAASDALSFTGGLRYTEEDKTIQGYLFNVAGVNTPEPAIPSALCPFAGPPPTQTGCLFMASNEFSESFSSVTGSASAQYRWTPELMTYLSWSQGFKSGGFNQRYNAAPPNNAPISFDEETADSWELGFKSEPAPGMRLNVAIFTTKYDDIQLTYRLGVVPLLFNAGKATISGAELEWNYAPSDELQIDASIGYLDDSFDSINNPPPFGAVTPTATADLSSSLPFAPEIEWHAGASYAFHVSPDLDLVPRIDVNYTDPQFFDAGNSANVAQTDSVTTVNASVTLASLRNDWRLSLNGYNLTDEVYPVAGTSSTSTSSGYAEVINARPRNYSVSFTKNF